MALSKSSYIFKPCEPPDGLSITINRLGLPAKSFTSNKLGRVIIGTSSVADFKILSGSYCEILINYGEKNGVVGWYIGTEMNDLLLNDFPVVKKTCCLLKDNSVLIIGDQAEGNILNIRIQERHMIQRGGPISYQSSSSSVVQPHAAKRLSPVGGNDVSSNVAIKKSRQTSEAGEQYCSAQLDSESQFSDLDATIRPTSFSSKKVDNPGTTSRNPYENSKKNSTTITVHYIKNPMHSHTLKENEITTIGSSSKDKLFIKGIGESHARFAFTKNNSGEGWHVISEKSNFLINGNCAVIGQWHSLENDSILRFTESDEFDLKVSRVENYCSAPKFQSLKQRTSTPINSLENEIQRAFLLTDGTSFPTNKSKMKPRLASISDVRISAGHPSSENRPPNNQTPSLDKHTNAIQCRNATPSHPSTSSIELPQSPENCSTSVNISMKNKNNPTLVNMVRKNSAQNLSFPKKRLSNSCALRETFKQYEMACHERSDSDDSVFSELEVPPVPPPDMVFIFEIQNPGIITENQQRLSDFEIPELCSKLIIGRLPNESLSFRIPHATVSAIHADLYYLRDSWRIDNRESYTKVNGTKICYGEAGVVISPGDEIIFGNVRYRLRAYTRPMTNEPTIEVDENTVVEMEETNATIPRNKSKNKVLIYEKHEWQHFKGITLNIQEKEREILIVFEDENKHLCYVFSRSRNQFYCRGCKNFSTAVRRRKDTCAFIQGDRVITQNGHNCAPRGYQEEMREFRNIEQLGGKPISFGEFEAEKYVTGEFQLVQYIDGTAVKKKLIIFDRNDHSRCHVYSYADTRKKYYCLGCFVKNEHKKEKQTAAWVSKLYGEDVVFAKDGHNCTLRDYKKVLESCSNKLQEIKSNAEFEVVDKLEANGDKSLKLIVKHPSLHSMCYVYRHSSNDRYRNFRCTGCSNLNYTSKATVSNANGEVNLIVDKLHRCQPISYDFALQQLSLKFHVDIAKCKLIFKDGDLKTLHVYSDDDETMGYRFTTHRGRPQNVYGCMSCRRYGREIYIQLKEENGNMISAIQYKSHLCKPMLLNLRPLPTSLVFRSVDWPSENDAVLELLWFKNMFKELHPRGTNPSTSTTYFLSTAPPTASPQIILSNAFYKGFSSHWIPRAFQHNTSGAWSHISSTYGTLWMYPFYIDIAPACEEMEAIGIALFQAGSIDLLMQNYSTGKFHSFDATTKEFIFERIATNKNHPDHQKLALAYKKYLILAASSESLKRNAINISKAPCRFPGNPVNLPVSYW